MDPGCGNGGGGAHPSKSSMCRCAPPLDPPLGCVIHRGAASLIYAISSARAGSGNERTPPGEEKLLDYFILHLVTGLPASPSWLSFCLSE